MILKNMTLVILAVPHQLDYSQVPEQSSPEEVPHYVDTT